MRGPKKFFKILLVVLVAITAVGFVVMHLWNWLMPAIFHLPAVSYWQALGLFVLSKLLLSGFRGGGHGGGHRWGRHMRERWEQMSPEEREKMREAMRNKWRSKGWCNHDRHEHGFWDREERRQPPSQSEASNG